jgi:DNA repair protein RadA/Sms
VRERHEFRCQECGAASPRWMGRCPGCGSYNTMVEERVAPASSRASVRVVGAEPLYQVDTEPAVRVSTGILEVDRILGGGVVPGALLLLGGDPGIGKSTLMLQVAAGMSRTGAVLYVSAEESSAQVRLRAERLGARDEHLFLLADGRLDEIERAIGDRPWRLVVVDSLQTVWDPALESAPGSVSQVREVAARVMRQAKATGVPVFLIGHVNKEGSLAGPRVVEHLVDVVLMFEGDRQHLFRMLRGIKNRFGPTQELGLFAMGQEGLKAVADPSLALLKERPAGAPGSAVAGVLQGSRPLLVEVQALVASAAGVPRRVVWGFPSQRLLLILAVLERHLGARVGDRDVFVKLTGGIEVDDPALDLAVAAAVVSSLKGVAVPANAMLAGEVGLTGEIRSAPQMAARVREARQLGLDQAVVPEDPAVEGGVRTVRHLRDLLGLLGMSSDTEAMNDVL